MATVQHPVIAGAPFLAKRTFVTVAQAVPAEPGNKGHLLVKPCVVSEPCCRSRVERLQMVSYHSEGERGNNFKT